MLNRADIMALVRLITLATGNSAGKHIIEPCSGFKGDIVADGYLNDLLVRNAGTFNNSDGIKAVVDEINASTNSIAVVRGQLYEAASGGSVGHLVMIYGIELNEDAILWFTRYCPTPLELFDFTAMNDASKNPESGATESTVMTPMSVRAVIETSDNQTESTEVEELDWFGKLSDISEDKKAWLLVQLNAAFTRIGRQDLFSEMLNKMESK